MFEFTSNGNYINVKLILGQLSYNDLLNKCQVVKDIY